jgi:hypothetical protein
VNALYDGIAATVVHISITREVEMRKHSKRLSAKGSMMTLRVTGPSRSLPKTTFAKNTIVEL